MKVLFAASEGLPFSMSGGLGDVAGSLPKAIRKKRIACRVVLPLYKCVTQEQRKKMKFITNFEVTIGWRKQYCGVFETNVDGVIFYLLDNEYYFYRDKLYGYYDDAERFAFFSRAALEMLHYISFTPDIIHCNDWQTALIPVYLDAIYRGYEQFKNIKTMFTIHNIQYQGKYGLDLVEEIIGIPKETVPWVEFDYCANFMKGAIERANLVTTVSPTYAKEILDPWFSHGLDGFLKTRSYKLSGILNGIDVKNYNPEDDSAIVSNYSYDHPEGKKADKADLQKMLGLDPTGDKPIVAMVSRLVSHKGLDLVRYAFDEIIAAGMQVVILGTGEKEYEDFFLGKARQYNGQAAVIIDFKPDLSRKVYAGADMFLMPSKSEPCGLSQMISLRYGTIPVVRQTGGLADSIIDVGSEGFGNGYTFKTYNAHDMLGALKRAAGLYYEDREDWDALVKSALMCDFSWTRSAAGYINLYENIIKQ